MRILIVDDDIINQKLLGAILADFGTIDLAENGEEAITLVKNNFKEKKYYDIIDPKTYVPTESIFGNFDLVLCRNLLIYFQTERQNIIFDKQKHISYIILLFTIYVKFQFF